MATPRRKPMGAVKKSAMGAAKANPRSTMGGKKKMVGRKRRSSGY